MRDGLEHRDRLIELLSRLRVLGRHLERGLAAAESQIAERGVRAQIDALDDLAALAEGPEQRIALESNALEVIFDSGMRLVVASASSVTPARSASTMKTAGPSSVMAETRIWSAISAAGT